MSRGREAGGAWALVPVKALGNAKTRLGAVLPGKDRARLQLAMLADVLTAAAEARGIAGIAVVTADPQAAATARRHGARVLDEAVGSDLNGALASGVAQLRQIGVAAIVVLAADLPLAAATEIDLAVARAMASRASVVVSDRACRGTNALAFTIEAVPQFAFGADSYFRHSSAPGAVALPLASLALDIDTPNDLVELLQRRAGVGAHTAAVLPALAFPQATEEPA